MKGYFSSLLIGLLLLFLFVPATSLTAETITLYGSTTCQKRFLEPGKEALAKATGINIEVFGVGSGKGMLALFEGKTTVALSSNILQETIKSAQKVLKKQGKPPIAVPAGLQYHTITEDVIVPIVNTKNTVTDLTWEQLADLHTGKITNWKNVGGPDLPVQVITSHAGSSTKAVFQKMVMKKADYVDNAILVQSTRLEIAKVSIDKGGIGAVSKGFHILNPGRTKIVNSDTISRPLGFITIGDPSPQVKQIINFFLSEEGKKYIVQ